MKKQTAVEWLVQELTKNKFIAKNGDFTNPLIEQSKAMEKNQIEDAFNDGVNDECIGGSKSPEQYYNETYGGDK